MVGVFNPFPDRYVFFHKLPRGNMLGVDGGFHSYIGLSLSGPRLTFAAVALKRINNWTVAGNGKKMELQE